MMHGIDVSSWQPADITARVDYDFAIIKATGGSSYVSPRCDAQVQAVRARGKRYGLYHFALDGYANKGARVEADFFVANIRGYLRDRPMLVLDWESEAVSLGQNWALEWCNRVYELTGIKPLFYSYASAIQNGNYSKLVAADYGLWIANYGANLARSYSDAPDSPPSTGNWPFAIMYQYGSQGRLSGYAGNLDLNVFYGDETVWDKYVGRVNAPPAPRVKRVAGRVRYYPFTWYIAQDGENRDSIRKKFGMSESRFDQFNAPGEIYPGDAVVVAVDY